MMVIGTFSWINFLSLKMNTFSVFSIPIFAEGLENLYILDIWSFFKCSVLNKPNLPDSSGVMRLVLYRNVMNDSIYYCVDSKS